MGATSINTEVLDKMEVDKWYTAKEIGIHGSTAAAWARRGLLIRQEGAVPARYKRPAEVLDIDRIIRDAMNVESIKRGTDVEFIIILFEDRMPMLSSLENGVLVDCYRHRYTAEMYSKVKGYRFNQEEPVIIRPQKTSTNE